MNKNRKSHIKKMSVGANITPLQFFHSTLCMRHSDAAN